MDICEAVDKVLKISSLDACCSKVKYNLNKQIICSVKYCNLLYYRHQCFGGKFTTRKIRDPSWTQVQYFPYRRLPCDIPYGLSCKYIQ